MKNINFYTSIFLIIELLSVQHIYTHYNSITQGSNIWELIKDTREVVADAQSAVEDIESVINTVSAKEDQLLALTDFIGKESGRRLDVVFDRANEIGAIASERLAEVMDRANEIGDTATSKFDDLFDQLNYIAETSAQRLDDVYMVTSDIDKSSQTIASFVEGIDERNLQMLELLNEVQENGDTLSSTLEIVMANGQLAGQAISNSLQRNARMMSVVDVVHECLDLGFKDSKKSQSKIFSKVETIDTNVRVGFQDNKISQGKIFSKVEMICNTLNTLKTVKASKSYDTIASITQQNIDTNGTFVIDQPGYYTLVEPLTFNSDKALQISADNVTVDLNGYTINGESRGADGTCIVLEDVHCITIKNGNLIGAQGIIITNAYDVNIEQVYVRHAINFGYKVDQSAFITIADCVIQGCNGRGVDMHTTSHVDIHDCTIRGNTGIGLSCVECSGTQIMHNILESNGSRGISISKSCDKVQVIDNRILNHVGCGLRNDGAGDSVFIHNVSTGNKDDYIGVTAVPFTVATHYWQNIQG